MAENAIAQSSSRRWSWIVLGCIVIASVYWSMASIRAVRVGEGFSEDLAHTWQTVWNVAHGNGFQHSHIPIHHNESRLATHADYILVLLAPLAWIWPRYEMLMIAQAVIVAIGAWYVFVLARHWLHDEALSALWAVMYLASGMVEFPVWWQFHGVTLAMTFILAMVEALIHQRRRWIAFVWLGLALITKEQVGFIAGPLWWLMARKAGWQREAWWGALFAIGYSLIHYVLILPMFAPTEQQYVFWKFYFNTLGGTPQTVIPRLLDPVVLWHRLAEWVTLDSAIILLAPVVFLPLLEPISLLALVALLPHWLSDQISVNSAYGQNHVLAVPILWISALLVVQRLQRRAWWVPYRRLIILSLIGLTALSSFIRSPNIWSLAHVARRNLVDADLFTIQKQATKIPASAVVGYSWGIPPIFQSRKTIYVLPYGVSDLDYAVVHPSISKVADPFRQSYYDQLFQYFDHDPAFSVVYRTPTIGIYQRLKQRQPGELPKDFVNPTPSWTSVCTKDCPSWNPWE